MSDFRVRIKADHKGPHLLTTVIQEHNKKPKDDDKKHALADWQAFMQQIEARKGKPFKVSVQTEFDGVDDINWIEFHFEQ